MSRLVFSFRLRACIAIIPFMLCMPLIAQQSQRIEGIVTDAAGRPAISALVFVQGEGAAPVTAATDAAGHFAFNLPAASHGLALRALAPGQQSESLTLPANTPITLVLHPTAVQQEITVTATRSAVDLAATASTAYVLTASQLQDFPATALDDKLRQQAGFELFRRASSNVANPTSEGISLRGLGSTAVSRTLVLLTGVPLNDPFGGWIHWDELPQTAIQSVDLATGGGSDLYGSSALGGVIDVVPARPAAALFDLSGFGGGQDTSRASVRADLAGKHLRQLLAGDSFRTNCYIPTAPSVLGPVDQAAGVHYQNLHSETDYVISPANRTFLTGNLLNEARNNGTRIQTNGTRLWRYIAGDDWSASGRTSGRVRLFGSDEAYRQSFSSINTTRTSENLTRLQHVRTQELGASADASFALSPIAFVTGLDVRDIRGTDNETPISAGTSSGVADTSARQRFFGGFGELLGTHGRWSAALSLRLDGAWNLSTRTLSYTFPAPAPLPALTPNRSEFIASPRLGIVRQLFSSASVHASVFRAFRTPTMNELYRTGQVGQEITQANAQLLSERATGWEIGATWSAPRSLLTLQGTYFWTEINRPVSAVLLSSTATTITNKRENLGQIISQGTELHAEIRPGHTISASLGYQYSHAVVTQFSAQPSLVGNWIPQVSRQSMTAQLRATSARLGVVTLALRSSGHAFDDSANTYPLAAFATLDLYARHNFGPHVSTSISLQNMLNQRPNVARTPLLTLGSPFLAEGGIDVHWNGSQAH